MTTETTNQGHDDRRRGADRGPFDGRPCYPESQCVTKALRGDCAKCGQAASLNPYSHMCDACDRKAS